MTSRVDVVFASRGIVVVVLKSNFCQKCNVACNIYRVSQKLFDV